MYWRDHQPPHFHAVYGDYGAMFSIETAEVIRGKFPKRGIKLVKQWTKLNRQDLMENWERAQAERELIVLSPLD